MQILRVDKVLPFPVFWRLLMERYFVGSKVLEARLLSLTEGLDSQVGLVLFPLGTNNLKDAAEIVCKIRALSRVPLVAVIDSFSPPAMNERIKILEAGADHCLSSPHTLDEARFLGAQIIATLKRANDFSSIAFDNKNIQRVGGVSLDVYSRILEHKGRKTRLSHQEFAIMEFLTQNPGKPLSPKVAAEHFGIRSGSFMAAINRLRVILDDASHKTIVNVWGDGYMLHCD